MKREEIEKLIDEKVQAKAAHYFGISSEFIVEQITNMHEGMIAFRDSMERQLGEMKGTIVETKHAVDTLSVDMVEVKERLTGVESELKEVKKDVKSLDKRVGNLEKDSKLGYIL